MAFTRIPLVFAGYFGDRAISNIILRRWDVNVKPCLVLGLPLTQKPRKIEHSLYKPNTKDVYPSYACLHSPIRRYLHRILGLSTALRFNGSLFSQNSTIPPPALCSPRRSSNPPNLHRKVYLPTVRVLSNRSLSMFCRQAAHRGYHKGGGHQRDIPGLF